MLPESCWNIKSWEFLLLVDSRVAERVRKAGCPHCDGGVLRVARYGRKPRGGPVSFLAGEDGLVLRHRFCCGFCRLRTTAAEPGLRNIPTVLAGMHLLATDSRNPLQSPHPCDQTLPVCLKIHRFPHNVGPPQHARTPTTP